MDGVATGPGRLFAESTIVRDIRPAGDDRNILAPEGDIGADSETLVGKTIFAARTRVVLPKWKSNYPRTAYSAQFERDVVLPPARYILLRMDDRTIDRLIDVSQLGNSLVGRRRPVQTSDSERDIFPFRL